MNTMTSGNRESARAQACGMGITEWRAAKEQSKSARTRGGKKARPESSLWDDCDGQGDLFAEGGDDE